MTRITVIGDGRLGWRYPLVHGALRMLGARAYHRVLGAAARVSAESYRAILGPLPRTIGIETINRCNGHCTFCPASVDADTRPAQTMPMALIEKLADELGRAGYSDYVALYNNNEPLLDRRIVDICRLFRRRVPGAWLTIATNGTVLTSALYRELMGAGLDKLLIDSYGRGEVIEPVRELVAEIDADPDPRVEDWRRRTLVVRRLQDERLLNRAGHAPNRVGDTSHRTMSGATCGQPFFQATVLPAGTVSPCCADLVGDLTVGDLHGESLAAIWNGDTIAELRRRLQRDGRGSLPLCRHCDSYLMNNWVWRRAVRNGLRRRVADTA